MDGIPRDAWAVRREIWDAKTGETLEGAWHVTGEWVRRDGLVSGIITNCHRVYHPAEVKLVGEDNPQLSRMCAECFLPKIAREYSLAFLEETHSR